MNTITEQNPDVFEAIGIFDSQEALQAAVDDLEQNGFMRQELSVLADERDAMNSEGYGYKSAEEIADDPDAPRTVLFPKEILGEAQGSLIGGPLYVAACLGAALGAAQNLPLIAVLAVAVLFGIAGGLVGLAFARYMTKRHLDSIQTHLRRGGLVLWVSLRAAAMQSKALDILQRHQAVHVHVHKLPLYGK